MSPATKSTERTLWRTNDMRNRRNNNDLHSAGLCGGTRFATKSATNFLPLHPFVARCVHPFRGAHLSATKGGARDEGAGTNNPMTAHELTPGDLDDACVIAYKLRTRGFAAVPSHDTARTIERLVTAYSSLVTRYDALREALGRDLDAGGQGNSAHSPRPPALLGPHHGRLRARYLEARERGDESTAPLAVLLADELVGWRKGEAPKA